MDAAVESQYPVRMDGHERADRRFVGLAKVVGQELELRGYPRLTGTTRCELERALFEFVYGSRGFAGELERRLNGTCAPLVSPEGKLDAYELAAYAHELRRAGGGKGALVVVFAADGGVTVGCAVEARSQADEVSAKLIAQLDDLAPGAIKGVGIGKGRPATCELDVEVDEEGHVVELDETGRAS